MREEQLPGPGKVEATSQHPRREDGTLPAPPSRLRRGQGPAHPELLGFPTRSLTRPCSQAAPLPVQLALHPPGRVGYGGLLAGPRRRQEGAS